MLDILKVTDREEEQRACVAELGALCFLSLITNSEWGSASRQKSLLYLTFLSYQIHDVFMLVFDRKYVKAEIGLLSEIFLLSETFLSLMQYLCVLLMTSYLLCLCIIRAKEQSVFFLFYLSMSLQMYSSWVKQGRYHVSLSILFPSASVVH